MTADQQRTPAQRVVDYIRSQGQDLEHDAELALARAEEVATDLAALRDTVAEWRNLQIGDAKHFHDRLRAIERALESPASVPRVTCSQCGGSGIDNRTEVEWSCDACGGNGRVASAQAEPATAHQEPPDRVLTVDEGLRDRIAEGVRDTITHYAKNINWPEEDSRSAFCEDIESDITDAVLAVLPSAPRVDVDAVLSLVREYAIACRAIADGSDYAVGEAKNYLAAIRALLEGTALGDSGRVVVDRARFERLLKPMMLYIQTDGIVVDFTGKGAIAFGKAFEDAINEIRANPGDLEPLP
jgi:hypothetical protein